MFDNITFRIDGYNIALMGKITDPTLKPYAETVVKGIDGVQHVDNQIEGFATIFNG